MRTKKGFFLVQLAIKAVPEFSNVVFPGIQVPMRRQSKSTLNNYLRCAVAPCDTFGTFTRAVNEVEMKRIPRGSGQRS
jgi:hypothetical protein